MPVIEIPTLPVAGAGRTRGCCQVLIDPVPIAAVEEAASILKVLGDPTRIRMLAMLSQSAEPICVCDFTAAFDLGQPTVSHHLGKLREIGAVTSAKEGVWTFYELAETPPTLVAAILASLMAA